jgi:hypothetical protein
METKEIKLGDYIRCFNPLTVKHEILNKYIGRIAKVTAIQGDLVNVMFEDGFCYYYSYNQAIKHLCNDDMKEFEKGLDANAKDSMKALDTLVIDKTINQMLQDVENPLKETPFHKPDFSHLKDPKLYSVLLSLGKMRMVYIDQTDEDVEQIKKQSPNWHTIIIEQQQDKGIQIIIKS